MKQDDKITKKFLLDLFKTNNEELREVIEDAEKRIKGNMLMEIKELKRMVFTLEMKVSKHHDEIKERLEWLIGTYKQFEDEHKTQKFS